MPKPTSKPVKVELKERTGFGSPSSSPGRSISFLPPQTFKKQALQFLILSDLCSFSLAHMQPILPKSHCTIMLS